MPDREIRTTSDPEWILALSGFLNLAFKDYLAARTLLNTGLALQGAALASTSVEKYLKAVLAFHGSGRPCHLNGGLLGMVRRYDAELADSLDHSFLAFLHKGYQLRYLDTVERGFNLCVSCLEVLAELDRTVYGLERRFGVGTGAGPAPNAEYQLLARERDPLLLSRNHVLMRQPREAFLAQCDSVYEMRVDGGGRILEATYEVDWAPRDGDFLREALRPVAEGSQPHRYQLALADDVVQL